MKYIKEIRREFGSVEFPVFRMHDLKTIEGLSNSYRRLLIHNMLSKKEIIRITRGIYTFHNDIEVIAFAFSPSYYGLEDALSIRKISDQGTNPVVITSRNVRSGIRSFDERKYLTYHIKNMFFFGYDIIKHGDFWIPVSDIEKTVIDMFYFKYEIRQDIWKKLLPLIDRKKLLEYLSRYNGGFRKKVLNELI